MTSIEVTKRQAGAAGRMGLGLGGCDGIRSSIFKTSRAFREGSVVGSVSPSSPVAVSRCDGVILFSCSHNATCGLKSVRVARDATLSSVHVADVETKGGLSVYIDVF